MGDDFYRSKEPTNSIKVLKEKATKQTTQKNQTTKYTHKYKIVHAKKIHIIHTTSPLIYSNMR